MKKGISFYLFTDNACIFFWGGGARVFGVMLITCLNVEISPDKEERGERGMVPGTQEGVLVKKKKMDNPRDFSGRGLRAQGFLLG